MNNLLQPTNFFKCLSDETRYHLVMLLQHHGELCVCEFTDLLELSQPKISRHLAQLRNCGILSDNRKGRWVYYQINPDLPQWSKSVIEEAFNGNQANLASLMKKKVVGENCCE